MRPPRLLLPLLLLAFAGAANAGPQRMTTDDAGNNGAPSSEPGQRDEDDASARRARDAKPAPARNGQARPAAPRWHSFLPGMFR